MLDSDSPSATLMGRSHLSCRPINIAFAADENYAPGLVVAIATALEACAVGRPINILVMEVGLSRRTIGRLEKIVACRAGTSISFVRVDLGKFSGARQMRGSALTYARLLLPDLLEGQSSVLYLDADVAYFMDISDLWDMDMEGSLVAACEDIHVKSVAEECPWLIGAHGAAPYFNAGILKIDLDGWRAADIHGLALKFCVEQRDYCRSWDQTALNAIIAGRVKWLDRKWNMQVKPGARSFVHSIGACNIHFITNHKPWLQFSFKKEFSIWRGAYSRHFSIFPHYMLALAYWRNTLARRIIVPLLQSKMLRSISR
jgi:lipopolysaccharide biosynthesis glycosyltransferase